jgi:uncharacterized protein YraI
MFFLRNGLRLVLLAAAVAIAMPAMATAAARPNGYPVTSVNLRAGPGTDYPKILTVPARAPIYAVSATTPGATWSSRAIEAGCAGSISKDSIRVITTRRPYTVGRWVFTDRYGWMWASSEPFGWATYHYGRWGFSIAPSSTVSLRLSGIGFGFREGGAAKANKKDTPNKEAQPCPEGTAPLDDGSCTPLPQ